MASNKQKHRHTVLSDKSCTSCGTKLKLNLVEKNPTASKCWRCFKGKTKGAYIVAEYPAPEVAKWLKEANAR